MKKKQLTVFFLLISLFPVLVGALPVKGLVFSEWALSAEVIYFTGGIPELAYAELNQAGTLTSVIKEIPNKEFKPWTTQLRPAGFISLKDGVFIAVNGGYPLLFKTATGKLVHPDRALANKYLESTAGLTVGSLYVDDEGAGIHLYTDNFFNHPAATPSESGRPVVIEVSAGALDVFGLNIPEYPFSAENTGWEPVELIHKPDRNIIAWKYSDDKKSLFRYIVHSPDGEAVDEIDEGYFRDEFDLLPAEDGSFALRGFIRAAREGAAGERLKNAGDIYLRLPAGCDGASEAVYISEYSERGNDSLPVQLQACRDGETWYILDEQSVFVCESNITVNELPALPEGFEYTGIWTGGGYMLLSWEETRFMYTARSGVIMIGMRDILN